MSTRWTSPKRTGEGMTSRKGSDALADKDSEPFLYYATRRLPALKWECTKKPARLEVTQVSIPSLEFVQLSLCLDKLMIISQLRLQQSQPEQRECQL